MFKRIILLIIAAGIIGFNLVPKPQTTFETAKKRQDHLKLGQIFLENNDYNTAKKEFSLDGLNYKTDVDLVTEDIRKWEKITINYPNYRDGYLKLAILNWKIFEDERVKNYLELAREIDPNSPLLQESPQSWPGQP